MTIITRKAKYCQFLINYAKNYGVTKAAIKYKTNKQYIYRWLKRYDGTRESLLNSSTSSHSHPNQHREDEIKLINNMRKRNKHLRLVVFWVKLRQQGYTRTITTLYRILIKR